MTQIEQIKAEIKRRIEQFKEERSKVPPTTPKSVDRLSLGARIAALEETLVFIKSLPYEQQSSSLDKFIHTLLETYPTNKNEVPKEALNDYHQGLICGARKTYNWILESMESAIKIDAKVVNDEMSGCVVDCEQGCLVLEPHRYPIGQKLKILILEDEQ